MKEYRKIVYIVKAFRYNGGIIKDVENIFMSIKPIYSNSWHDRFIDEPSEPTPYILDEDKKRIYIKNSDWIVTKNNGLSYFILSDIEFLEQYENI
jgi:hypothetical protein